MFMYIVFACHRVKVDHKTSCMPVNLKKILLNFVKIVAYFVFDLFDTVLFTLFWVFF